MQTKFMQFVLLAFVSVFFGGCASMKPLPISTRPAGAQVTVIDSDGHKKTGITPVTFQVSPKKELEVNIYKKGYEPVQFTGSAYVQQSLSIKNAANAALVFIAPPVGAVWGGARYFSGDFKSFDKIDIQLEPLQHQQIPTREVVRDQPPAKKREIVEEKPRPRNTETIEIEVEVFSRELEREFDGSEGTRPKVKTRYIPAPRENDED